MLEAKKRFKTLGREWPDNFARDVPHVRYLRKHR